MQGAAELTNEGLRHPQWYNGGTGMSRGAEWM